LATLLGALILLSLIAYLVMALRGRQANVVKTKLAKTPKAQPRYSDDELSELGGSADKQPQRESTPQTPLAKAAVAGTPQDKDPWVLTMPTIVTPASAPEEQSEQEEDREVFEL
jgi:predicted lipid-binding transport protein (Tim44 family)